MIALIPYLIKVLDGKLSPFGAAPGVRVDPTGAIIVAVIIIFLVIAFWFYMRREQGESKGPLKHVDASGDLLPS